MGFLDNLLGKKKKESSSGAVSTGNNFIDIRKHPLEKKAIKQLIEEYNEDVTKPSARLTISKEGKADVWLSGKKWAEYNHQGLQLRNAGRYQEALQMFDAAIKEAPSTGIPHHGKADVLLRIGNYEGALKECNLAISLDKKNPEEIPEGKPALTEFYFRKIQVLMKLGRFGETFEPEMEKYLMKMDREGYERGRDKSRELHKMIRGVASAPKPTKAQIAEFKKGRDKAYALMKSGDFEHALEEITKAVKANPKDTSGHVLRALIIIRLKNMGKLKDDSEAGREMILAEALEPRNPDIVFVNGMVGLGGGLRSFAEEKFVRVKFLDSDYITKKKSEKYGPFMATFGSS
jgi:tetratricopeptide (TPR) repeat protein